MSHTKDYEWQSLLSKVQNQIQSNEDVLLVVIHWMFIRAGLQCLGLATEKADTKAVGSDSLPSGWNAENAPLNYAYNNIVYTLIRTRSNRLVIFNLINTSNSETHSITINTESVESLSCSLEKIFHKHEEIIGNINRQLIKPVVRRVGPNTRRQNEGGRRSPSPEEMSTQPNTILIVPSQFDREPRGEEIGRSDRDPLWSIDPLSSGGGMIYDPFRHPHGSHIPYNPGAGVIGGIPRNSIPPGARFDPVGPFNPTHPRRPHPSPRPDHLRPPDSDDFPPPGNDDPDFIF